MSLGPEGEEDFLPAISVRDLHRSYGSVRAVDGISFEVEDREIFGILGPNGAGKTTTLEMIETLREPDSGEITVSGMDVTRDARAIKELIGVQLQTTVFFDNLTVLETVDLFGTFYRNRVPSRDLLALVGLQDKAGSMLDELSGGQHKRVSIALALVNDPRIVFLDEPTTGLDPQARRNIWEIVEQLRDRENTVIITTHYIEEAEYLCDRVAIMDHGRIIALGSPDELIDLYSPENNIFFRLEPELSLGLVSATPGVEEAMSVNGGYEVTTLTPQETLIGVFKTAYDNGSVVNDVSMKRATLEDVFLKITGRRIRE
jgi:ABC-2 type transport system ATP-binding protein